MQCLGRLSPESNGKEHGKLMETWNIIVVYIIGTQVSKHPRVIFYDGFLEIGDVVCLVPC